MRELLLLHPLVIFLKLSVMPEAQQEDRPIMHFHLHTLIRWELDVVIACLFMKRDRTDKGDDPLVPPPPRYQYHPACDASHWDTSMHFPLSGYRFWIPFPEPLRNLDVRFVQSNIRFLQHLLVCYHNQYFILFIKHLKFWYISFSDILRYSNVFLMS